MIDRIMPPCQDVHVLIPKPMNFTFHSKRDFEGVIKFNALRLASYLGEPNTVTKVFLRGSRGLESEK